MELLAVLLARSLCTYVLLGVFPLSPQDSARSKSCLCSAQPSLLYRGFAPHLIQHTRVHTLGSENRISEMEKKSIFFSQAGH